MASLSDPVWHRSVRKLGGGRDGSVAHRNVAGHISILALQLSGRRLELKARPGDAAQRALCLLLRRRAARSIIRGCIRLLHSLARRGGSTEQVWAMTGTSAV